MLNTKLVVTTATVAALLVGCAGGETGTTSAPATTSPAASATASPAASASTGAATPTAGALPATPTAGVLPATPTAGALPATPTAATTVLAAGAPDTLAGSTVGNDGVRRLLSSSASGFPTGSRVYPNFFGVHDATATGRNGWPLTNVGTIRLWDAGVSWREIEKTKDKYDFARLDALVRQANLKGAETLIVLGQTPRFYATKVARTDVNGPGAASMPNNLAAWKRYVQAVANRPGIRGNRKVQFQVWNEANVVQFWNGSPAQMALLTKVTRDALAPTKSSRFLVAPAMVTRASFQRTWMDKYYGSKVNGRRVGDYVNAVSLQLYPLPAGKPEDSMAILALDKKILAKYRVTKPIWNTEVNYGLNGARNVRPLSPAAQAAGVSRTYLLNAAGGVKRVYWYTWGDTRLANTRMTGSNGYSLTPAGRAYGVTRSWLLNSQLRSCTRNSAGTYTCAITYTGGVKRVFWNPSRVVTVAVAGATTHQLVDGTTRKYTPRTTRLKVGPSPVMIRSAR